MERNKVMHTIMLATIFTFAEMFMVYLLLTLKLFGKYNVFLAYRKFFEGIIIFDKLYFFFVGVMNKIFGLSYLYVAGFNNVFKLAFFAIFILNISFLFLLEIKKKKRKG